MKNMSADYYVNHDVLLQERTAVFSRCRQLFGHSDHVQEHSSYISGDLAGMAVFVIRSHDNQRRTFRNVCRHRGARLLDPATGPKNR